MSAESNKEDSLLAAVKANNYEETKKLLNDHGLILDKNFSDYNLLIQALHLGHKKIAKLLLDKGCRVFCQQKNNQKSTAYSTPLCYAVKLNCLELVEILLNKGVSIKYKDANNEMPLSIAMNNDYIECVDLMLSKYKITNININNEDEIKIFHIAIMRDNTKLVKSFLEHGMPVDQTSKIKSSTSQGNTPLHFAVEYKSIETVKLLLSKKANFALKNGHGLTPLHLAFYSNNCERTDKIIDLILSAHVKVMVNPTDANGVSHFHIACSKSNLRLLESFLKSGENCNNCTSSKSSILPGYAPLHIAVKYNCKNTVKLLLDHEADVNKATGTGATPLHLAVESDDDKIEIIELLLKYNANVCAVDNNQNTAIHKAFEESQRKELNQSTKSIINLLFSAHQGNIENVSNKEGLNLFHIACATSKNLQLIETFLKQNVNINACVEENTIWAGYSALHFAIKTSNSEVIEILLQKCIDLKTIMFSEYSLLSWTSKFWFDDAIKATSLELPMKILEDQNFRKDILSKLESINKSRYQIFKLFLKRKEVNDSIIFDVCNQLLQGLYLLQEKAIISQSKILYELQANQLVTIFKTVMISLIQYESSMNLSKKLNYPILQCLIQVLKSFYSESIIELIELFLIRGAEVDFENQFGVTPLMMAALECFSEVVDILLKYKANPSKCCKRYGCTAVHYALGRSILYMGRITIDRRMDTMKQKVLMSCLQHNFKVNSQCCIVGFTALHLACWFRNLPALITLLDYGADINVMHKGNITPLELMFQPCPDIANLTLDNSEMLKILELHINKLNFIGFTVSQKNIDACDRIKSFCKMSETDKFCMLINGWQPKEESITFVENNIFIEFFSRELRRMKNIKIDAYSSLYSIIFKNDHKVSKCINSEIFKELVNSTELKENFPLYGYILNLQYKKGLERYALLKPVKEVLESIFDLPDPVYEQILVNFTNEELKQFYSDTKNQ